MLFSTLWNVAAELIHSCVIFGKAGVHIWARRPAIYLEFLRFSLSVNAVSRIVP
jgi:hypothetical protein